MPFDPPASPPAPPSATPSATPPGSPPASPSAAPPVDTSPLARNRRAVGQWLLIVAGMIWVMVVLGGATRLHGSGLSIMEWDPIMGVIPPLSHAEWERLFKLYQQIPQYKLVNDGFGLAGFQRIFWLEWVHRLWGRLLGVVFIVPLLWFWVRGRLPAGTFPRLLVLFIIGGLQGAVGWFMVSSGFEADSTAVSPYRLVAHLALALALYGAVLWFALGFLRAPAQPLPPAARPLRGLTHLTAGLTVLTMLAGGFVAGTHAGFDYNTFPLMGGHLVPQGYGVLTPFARNFFENVPAVQFDHRLLATLSALAALATGIAAWRLPREGAAGAARSAGIALLGAVALQYILGVSTLLLVVPPGLATLHQGCAVLVLTADLVLIHTLRRPRGAASTRPISA